MDPSGCCTADEAQLAVFVRQFCEEEWVGQLGISFAEEEGTSLPRAAGEMKKG